MNIILIIAAVIAVIASAARSRKGYQSVEQEAWPTDMEPQTTDRKPLEYKETTATRPQNVAREEQSYPSIEPHKAQKQHKEPRKGQKSENRVAGGRFTTHTTTTNVSNEQNGIANSETTQHEQHELLRNFDPQQAIVYSEIMKPKFEEYE